MFDFKFIRELFISHLTAKAHREGKNKFENESLLKINGNKTTNKGKNDRENKEI